MSTDKATETPQQPDPLLGLGLSEGLGLAPDVCELLRERDMFAERHPWSKGLLLVRDEEGTELFQMTPAISALDLRLMLAYAWRLHQEGLKHGQKIARNVMRGALGLQSEA